MYLGTISFSVIYYMFMLQEDFGKKLDHHANTTASTFKVLNHGDLWVNNFLFKYEEGQPIDVVFVDYQMSFYSSPGIDLNYFINTSPKNEVRELKYDRIIEFYHASFANALKTAGSTKNITLDQMRKEISTREFYGFMASVGILPLVLMDKETSQSSNMESLSDETAAIKLRNSMYNNPNYVRTMKYILKRFDEHNVFVNVSNQVY